MLLNKLISKVEVINKVGDLNLDITNIHSDSRKIKEGGLFIAINGFTKNGIEFIPNAIKNGAKALIVEPDVDINSLNISKNIPIISVSNTRRALAQVACEFYDNPSKKLKLIGITGTKGKTTTTFMVKSILEAHGLNVGLIGSIAVYINNEKIEDTDRTTPESIEIQKHLATMVKKNVDVAIIEVSSQAMKLDRVVGCDFDITLFTNLSEDHISPKEHPTMEDYFEAKLSLLKMSPTCVINLDNEYTKKIPNLLPNKNIITAVRALKYIPLKYNVSLTIIGSGYQKKDILDVAVKSGRGDDVTIIDEMPREDVLKLVAQSDIFLFPSLREGGSWSLMEAMTIGVPVVCLDWAGMSITTDDSCAIRLPVTTPEQMPKDMATAIIKLIENPELRNRMGSAGRKRIKEKFNWEEKGRFMDNLLKKLDAERNT